MLGFAVEEALDAGCFDREETPEPAQEKTLRVYNEAYREALRARIRVHFKRETNPAWKGDFISAEDHTLQDALYDKLLLESKDIVSSEKHCLAATLLRDGSDSFVWYETGKKLDEEAKKLYGMHTKKKALKTMLGGADSRLKKAQEAGNPQDARRWATLRLLLEVKFLKQSMGLSEEKAAFFEEHGFTSELIEEKTRIAGQKEQLPAAKNAAKEAFAGWYGEAGRRAQAKSVPARSFEARLGLDR